LSSGPSPTRTPGAQAGERCLVIHPRRGRADDRTPQARLDEAASLAGAIGLAVVDAQVVGLLRPAPATLLGKGTVERLAAEIAQRHERGEAIDVAVIDHPVSPVQQRNLERALKCKVIDRTGLILEIFGARARTREGRLQVELAALTYQRSRLVRSWTHLERQRGGFGFMGGPGETQIEADRRQIDERLVRIKRELAQVRRTRTLHREARQRVPYPVVALVGYTNAGKSTLFNRLTSARVLAKDILFATLDPTMRGVTLPSGRRAILSDTVGFVSDLPHELVEAFRATLEEVSEASEVVHVRDAAHPDRDAQKADVLGVLAGLGAGGAEGADLIEVENKIDLLGEAERTLLANQAARANRPMILVSAATGEGCEELLQVIDGRLAQGAQVVEVALKPEDGASLAWLYRRGEVVERRDEPDAIHLKVRLAAADAERLARRLG